MSTSALLIEVDFLTGRRAGDVDPKDPALQSYDWQSLPTDDHGDFELRVVEDSRDLSGYSGEVTYESADGTVRTAPSLSPGMDLFRIRDVTGVVVIESTELVNDVIAALPYRYSMREREFEAWLGQEQVDLPSLPSDATERMKAIRREGGPVRIAPRPFLPEDGSFRLQPARPNGVGTDPREGDLPPNPSERRHQQ